MENKKTYSIKGKTAVMVIHGIGEQNPYETLDQFGRGLHNMFGRTTHVVHHRLAKQDNNKGDKWIDSYIRIVKKDAAETDYLDVHEYYWANLTEEQISTDEINEWFKTTIKGANKIYFGKDDDKDFVQSKEVDLTMKNKKLKPLKDMLWKVIFAYRVVQALKWMANIFVVLKIFTFFINPLIDVTKAIKNWLGGFTSVLVRGYIGDVAIYTTMDVKKKHYDLREKIITGARTQLENLLKDERYDKIIIAGHSLGSVIAYDILNKINIRASIDKDLHELCDRKIKGLVTFGSPLDKIFFFFSEHTAPEEYIRRQVTEHLHSFRVKNIFIPKEKFIVSDPVTPCYKDLKWINFWHKKDPVSNFLDFYTLNRNIRSTFDAKWGVAHVGYWEDDTMYTDIYDDLL